MRRKRDQKTPSLSKHKDGSKMKKKKLKILLEKLLNERGVIQHLIQIIYHSVPLARNMPLLENTLEQTKRLYKEVTGLEWGYRW